MDWISIILSTVIGIPIGILCSLAAWWILFYVIVPKIRFSPSISKISTKEGESNILYRVAFQNSGRRGIVDAEIYAKILIWSLHPEYPYNVYLFSVPLGYEKLPKIIPQKGGFKHIVILNVTKIDELVSHTFPDECILSNFEKNPNLLEDILSLGQEAYLQIYLFGFDEVSGTRKVFESKQYYVNDVVNGKFSLLSLEVVRRESGRNVDRNADEHQRTPKNGE
jgi:hypothetical protein